MAVAVTVTSGNDTVDPAKITVLSLASVVFIPSHSGSTQMLSPRLIHSPCSKPSLFNPFPPTRKQTCLGCLNGLLSENRRRGHRKGAG